MRPDFPNLTLRYVFRQPRKALHFLLHRKEYYQCRADYEKSQASQIDALPNNQDLVIFFNIAGDNITGGMLSINHFAGRSQLYAKQHGFTAVQSGIPFAKACIPSSYFDYHSPFIEFTRIIRHYRNLRRLLINIPETCIPDFLNGLTEEMRVWFARIPDFRINIMNQNDELMPEQKYIEMLRGISKNRITITTAHHKYCTAEKAEQYGCPIFSLVYAAVQFKRISYKEKEDIIVFSSDESPARETVQRLIETYLPKFKIVIVQKMKFEKYRELIGKCKYSFTFGEGFDGYFVEPFWSGSIGFSVRNSTFFPAEFDSFPTVYASWERLYENIIADILSYEDSVEKYESVVEQFHRLLPANEFIQQSADDLDAYYERWLESNTIATGV